MITAILIMNWILNCALCAAAGYSFGKRSKNKKSAAPNPGERESERFKREMREMENFFSYDGFEQTDEQ